MRQILLLRVYLGEKELEQRPFTRDKIILGRDPYADVYLEDPQVSRVHAAIELRDGGFYLGDCSSNGTRVNGRLVQSTVLSDGDEIEVGRFRVLVEIHEDATDASIISKRSMAAEIEDDQTLRSPS